MITLAEARKKKGWTQLDLAQKLNITASTVSMYESGARGTTIARFKKIAELLEVSMDELVLNSK